MKKINILLFCSIALLWVKSVSAQSTLVHISDLNPVTDIDSIESLNNKVRFVINFKIDNPAQADSVFVKFGTSAQGSEILTNAGNVKKIGGNYFVKIQAASYQVINTEVSCKVKITKAQYALATYVSIIVKDKSGLYSNELSIRIN